MGGYSAPTDFTACQNEVHLQRNAVALQFFLGAYAMKPLKLNEDWLSVVIAFALIALALVGVIAPSWLTF